MKSIKLLLASALFLAACSGNKSSNEMNSGAEQSKQNKIVGGDEVYPGDETMVSTIGIYDQKGFLCTGTLISKNLVLTAAHCISDDPTKAIIIFANQMTAETVKNGYPVVAAKVSDNMNLKAGKNTGDIAVMKFANDGELPQGYAPAKLLKDFSLLRKGIDVVVAGYGLNWSWIIKRGSGTLRTTELQVADPTFSETEISLQQSLRRGVCSGDSGGPAYLRVDGQLYLWGVTSRGDSLPIPMTPDCFIFSVFTRADVYGAWIAKTAVELNQK